VASTSLSGGIFAHLRACRQLILWLLAARDRDSLSTADKYLLGVVIEHYAYLILLNTLTPHGMVPGRTLPVDDFITNLPDTLASYPTGGMVICGYEGLLCNLPEIALLAAQVLRDEAEPDFAELPPSTRARHAELSARIAAWALPEDLAPVAGVSTSQRAALGEAFRHGVRIFLEAGMLGAGGGTAAQRLALQAQAVAVLRLAVGHGLTDSALTPMLLWPALMGGCVLVDGAARQMLTRSWRGARYATWIGVRTLELLERLWDEEGDPSAWGPYGLGVVMKRYGISISMA
jgi:hypothetical protein